MQPQKKSEGLFSLKLIHCDHILNVPLYEDPDLQDIPLSKGNIFLGGVFSFKPQIINGFKISAVLSILDEAMYKRDMIRQKIEGFKIDKHKWIDFEDNQEDQEKHISDHFEETHLFIKEALKEHNLLVHCQVGSSRSATVLIAFLMREYRVGFKEAFEIVAKRRKVINPNQKFRKELVQYEKYIFGLGDGCLN